MALVMTFRRTVTLLSQSGLSHRSNLLATYSQRNVVTSIESTAQFEELLKKSDKLLVIDYKADWCGPCKRMAPLFEKMSEEYDENCEFLKIDCDDLPELASQRGVASLPTFELVKNGTALEQIIGANPTKLEQCIANHLEGK